MTDLNIEELKAHGTSRGIKFIGKENSTTAGEVYVQHFSDSMRLWRGTKTGLIFLGVTFVCAFVPIAHFILVPLLLVVTIIAASMTIRPKSIILGGTGTCPFCAKPFRIFRRADKSQFTDVCEGCGRQVTIDGAETAQSSSLSS